MTNKRINKIFSKLLWDKNLLVEDIDSLLNFLSDFKQLKIFRIINAAYGKIIKFAERDRVD